MDKKAFQLCLDAIETYPLDWQDAIFTEMQQTFRFYVYTRELRERITRPVTSLEREPYHE